MRGYERPPSRTPRNKEQVEKVYKDTKVEDIGYDFTSRDWPGYLGDDPNLDRAERLHTEMPSLGERRRRK